MLVVMITCMHHYAHGASIGAHWSVRASARQRVFKAKSFAAPAVLKRSARAWTELLMTLRSTRTPSFVIVPPPPGSRLKA